MPTIRFATPEDAAGVQAIYGPIVEQSSTSFEMEVPTLEDLGGRIERALEKAPWLVAEEDGVILGYVYAVPFRGRQAYQWSMEVSVYVHHDHHRRRVGRSLYEALFEVLKLQGFHMLIAGVTLPNPASVALHESMGFSPCATFQRVGFKFGAWHDVGFWEMQLADVGDSPAPPRLISEVPHTALAEAAKRIR